MEIVRDVWVEFTLFLHYFTFWGKEIFCSVGVIKSFFQKLKNRTLEMRFFVLWKGRNKKN